MNMFKKNGGFTLVELIVVIAILAILAGVAIPAYSGYINSANKAADITVCDAVKTAAMAALATKGEVTKVVITSGSVKATCAETEYEMLGATPTNADIAKDFVTFFGSSTIPAFKSQTDSKVLATKATWDNSANAASATKGEWVFGN